MRWVVKAASVAMLLAGLCLLAKTGDTVWASDEKRDHTIMIYLLPLFFLFPLVGLGLSRKRR